MTETSGPPSPPAWVYKRDGRLVPFEADKISRSLFAATETVGHPDAFMARELADGVLHFLSQEMDNVTPTTGQVSAMVIKIVRELGQPSLAQAFADHYQQHPGPKSSSVTSAAVIAKDFPAGLISPALGPSLDQLRLWMDAPVPTSSLVWRAGRACLRDYALREVFTRDLIAAQADGLITLTGLETPLELAGSVIDPLKAGSKGVVETIEEARHFVGQVVAIDGPEYTLANFSRPQDTALASYARELEIGLRATGLRAVVNLNCALAPPWASDLASGPLFSDNFDSPAPGFLAELAHALVDELCRLDAGCGRMRVDWHLGERDFAEGKEEQLLTMARRALDGAALAFVFDRPRRPILLAEGMDRQKPAFLMSVGLHLSRLAEREGVEGNPSRFLKKLGSLARLALSAGVQKRDFLRSHGRKRPVVTQGFRLDRAHQVMTPVGLEPIVRSLLNRDWFDNGDGLELGKQIVHRLQQVLDDDSRLYYLDACLDSTPDFTLEPLADENAPSWVIPTTLEVAGISPWNASAPMKNQIKVGGALQGIVGRGTLAVRVPEGETLSPEGVIELLRYAWKQTEAARFRLIRLNQPLTQLVAPWEN